jgi:putative ABC transport system permease protein
MRAIRNLIARRRVERELDEELRGYLEELTAEKQAAGMGMPEARRAARLEMGGVEQVKEEVRDVRSGRVLEQLWQDVRYGARTLRKNPAFTAVAILALALGIGANTAMFSVAYGMLWRPLPYPNADRVAVVFMRFFPRDFLYGTMCVRDYLIWKEHNRAFEQPALFRNRISDLGGSEGFPEQVQSAIVTASFFSTLGVRPLIGRTFAAGEDRPAAASVAVLGEGVWRKRFGANPGVLGKTITVNGAPSTIIGVMPDEFHAPLRDTQLWTNLALDPPTRYGPWFYRGVARLKPGATLQQAQTELDQIARLMMQQRPDYKRLKLPVMSLRDAMLGVTLKPALLVLAGAVGLVLLIAMVNVANLMLARATVREREMALRLSLGAGRARLVRQLLTESVLLAMAGGGIGLVLAWGGVQLLRAWNPGNIPFIDAVRLDWSALGFMMAVSVVTGILFGLAPAWENSRAGLNSAIKDRHRGRRRALAVLVVSEIAISLMLLVGAGLLLRSFAKLQGVDGGFTAQPRSVVRMFLSPTDRKYNDPATGLAFYEEVLQRARRLPGVQYAAITDSLPPDQQGDADTFGIEGQSLPEGEINPIVTDATVGPDYFRVLGISLLKGRYFTNHDTAESLPVAIVSEGFAKRFLPNQEPLGKRIRQSGPGVSGAKWMEIVGVVGNVKYLGLTMDTDPAYYMPFAQSYGQRMFLVARTSGDAAPLTTALLREVRSIDRGVTLAWTGTLDELMQRTVAQPRFDTMLLVLFASIALLLAAVGIYGLIAYTVAQRTHEIGVRMALGAGRGDVVGMVLQQGGSLAVAGIACGLAGAFALTRLLGAMLFGVGATDTATFVCAAVALLAVVLAATLVPALRATRISPVAALRYE